MSQISSKPLYRELFNAVKFRYDTLSPEKQQMKTDSIWNELKSTSIGFNELKQSAEEKIKQLRGTSDSDKPVKEPDKSPSVKVKHLIMY